MRDRRDRGRAAGCFLRTLLVLALLVVIVALVATFYTGASPNVAVQSKLKGIGRRTPIQVRIEDPQRVSKVTVEVVQGQDVKKVAERELQAKPAWAFGGAPPVEMTVEVGRETVQGLRTGTAKVRVTAEREGTWLRRPAPAVAEIELPVRLAPPTLQIQSTFHYVRQGGSEAVVYRVGEGAVRDGVQAGSWWFPGFPVPGSNDKQQRFAFFAVPFDMGDPSGIRLVAIDDVGNRAEAGFIDKFTPSPPRADTIELNDQFMNKVVSEIMSQSPEVADQGNPPGQLPGDQPQPAEEERADAHRAGEQVGAAVPLERAVPADDERRHQGRLRRPADLRLQRQAGGPAGPSGVRHGLGGTRRHPRLEQRTGGAGPLLRDLRQRGGDRPRLSACRASTGTCPRSA